MKRKIQTPQNESVVSDVRAIRARLWKQGGGTAKGYLELMSKLAAQRKGETRSAAKSKTTKAKKTARRRAA
jgi:hypothetical protein